MLHYLFFYILTMPVILTVVVLSSVVLVTRPAPAITPFITRESNVGLSTKILYQNDEASCQTKVSNQNIHINTFIVPHQDLDILDKPFSRPDVKCQSQ